MNLGIKGQRPGEVVREWMIIICSLYIFPRGKKLFYAFDLNINVTFRHAEMKQTSSQSMKSEHLFLY